MSLKKEVIDQSAHFAIGFVIVVALSFFIPVIWAGAAVFGIALVRELHQHPQRRWFQLGSGSRRDLLFWALGIGLAVGLVLADII